MPRGVFEENFETFPPRLFLCSLNREWQEFSLLLWVS